MPYVFCCVGCGEMNLSERSDALTCSPACRTRAHRNGELKRLRALAEKLKISAATILQAKAVKELCPELNKQIAAGKLHWRKDPYKRPKILEAFTAKLNETLVRARAAWRKRVQAEGRVLRKDAKGARQVGLPGGPQRRSGARSPRLARG